MYILDKNNNKLEKINTTTFSEQNLKERYNLQEWIDTDPSILGEDLLVIQKEFDGFDKTKERLDLLALDKRGNLVLIENKLDDSGKDVTWQALKYASYCAELGKNEILSICQLYLDQKGIPQNASEYINEFLDDLDISEVNLNVGYNQRIILVAKEFRPEVTNVVLWLRAKNIDIQCIKVTPYIWQNDIIVDVDKIIPVPEAEDYMIRLLAKEIEEEAVNKLQKSTNLLYSDYWSNLLDYFSKQNHNLYRNRTKSKDGWIGTGAGISNVSYNLILLKSEIRVELYINQSKTENNKLIFDKLLEYKGVIESKFGEPLVWERLDNKRASRISYSLSEFYRDERDKWNEAIKWHYKHINRLEEALREPLQQIRA